MAESLHAKELRSEAQALQSALLANAFPYKRKLRGTIKDSGHLGSYTCLFRLEDGGELQVWLDEAAGLPRSMYWVGLYYADKASFDSMLLRLSDLAKPRTTLRLSDLHETEQGFVPKQPLDPHALSGSIAERLDGDDKDDEFYIGRYFDDYDTGVAIGYLRSLIGQDQLPLAFWEGEVLQRMASFYERDPRAREACLAKLGYKCVVCSIDFSTVYGAVGEKFIHVHHIVPLSARSRSSETRINELVPVCPNCHAMLHRQALKSPEELQAMMKEKAGQVAPPKPEE